MENKERVNAKSLYEWINQIIESYGEKYGSLLYQTDWIPLPDYFFKNKNDKIFSSAIHISYDDDDFCFGVVTNDYIEPIAYCSLNNVIDNDKVFQKELGSMLESILNRQEGRAEECYFITKIKKSILEKIKDKNYSFLYDIKDYMNYNEQQEKELLKKIFTFEFFETNKSKNKISKEVNAISKVSDENLDEIYEKKYKELRSLFYSPDTEKYPKQEIIYSKNLKIEADSLQKEKIIVVNDLKYKVVEDVIFKTYNDDFIESLSGEDINLKVSHKGQVILNRSSDNNLYSMDIYILREKDKNGNNIYYSEGLVEEQLYIHDVTVSLPEDNRPLTINSYLIEQKFKEMYREYDIKKAYKREDFKRYLKNPIKNHNIQEEVLNEFKKEFKNNKELLLKDNFDIRKWSDNIIRNNYGLNLSSKKSTPSLRKRRF